MGEINNKVRERKKGFQMREKIKMFISEKGRKSFEWSRNALKKEKRRKANKLERS